MKRLGRDLLFAFIGAVLALAVTSSAAAADLVPVSSQPVTATQMSAIPFSEIRPLLRSANYLDASIDWAERNVSYYVDGRLLYGEAYCWPCLPPAQVHIGPLSVDRFRVTHETQHAIDWPTLNRAQRRVDQARLGKDTSRSGDVARWTLAGCPDDRGKLICVQQEEHFNTYVIEKHAYKVGPVPDWYRARYAANYRPIWMLELPGVWRDTS